MPGTSHGDGSKRMHTINVETSCVGDAFEAFLTYVFFRRQITALRVIPYIARTGQIQISINKRQRFIYPLSVSGSIGGGRLLDSSRYAGRLLTDGVFINA
ncbi:MAG: hypothetical protein K2Z81_12295 [Cyanobacteria bacterium]|nr:hypothetical protein [Cyanobacteriota bacterium]